MQSELERLSPLDTWGQILFYDFCSRALFKVGRAVVVQRKLFCSAGILFKAALFLHKGFTLVLKCSVPDSNRNQWDLTAGVDSRPHVAFGGECVCVAFNLFKRMCNHRRSDQVSDSAGHVPEPGNPIGITFCCDRHQMILFLKLCQFFNSLRWKLIWSCGGLLYVVIWLSGAEADGCGAAGSQPDRQCNGHHRPDRGALGTCGERQRTLSIECPQKAKPYERVWWKLLYLLSFAHPRSRGP